MNEQLKLKKATYHLKTFLISKLIGALGANVYAFGISMYVLSLTGSSLSFSLVLLCSILSQTIASPIAGVLGDRVSRKMLVLGGQFGVVLTMAALFTYTLANDFSLIAIYIATTLIGIFNSFSGIAFSASIANLVDEARLQKAMSFNQMAASTSGIGGPIIGGILFGFLPIEYFLLIFLFTGFIALILESTMDFKLYTKIPTETATAKIEQESMFESFKSGIAYIKSDRLLVSLLSVSFGLNFFFTCLSVGGDFTLLTIIKMDPKLIGLTEAASAVGVLLASIYFATSKAVKFPLLFSKRSILAMSTLVMLAALPVILHLSAIGNFIYYVILMFAFGTTLVMTNMPIGVLFQTKIAEEFRSRVFSILSMVSMSLMPLATLIYGLLFEVVPAQYIFLVSGLCLVLITLITIRPSVIHLAHPEIKKAEKKSPAQQPVTQK